MVKGSYRALLKAIKLHISPAQGTCVWRRYVAKEFRKDLYGDQAERRSQLADDVAFLVTSVHQQRVRFALTSCRIFVA